MARRDVPGRRALPLLEIQPHPWLGRAAATLALVVAVTLFVTALTG